jgi:hypothetical protein
MAASNTVWIFSGLKSIDLRSRAFKAGGNQLVRSGGSDQTLVRFSYFIPRNSSFGTSTVQSVLLELLHLGK